MNETLDVLFQRIERLAIENAILESKHRAQTEELRVANEIVADVELQPAVARLMALDEEGPDAAENYEPDISPQVEGEDIESEDVTFEPCGEGFLCEYGDVGAPADLKAHVCGYATFIADTHESREWAIEHLRERADAN